MGKIYKNSLFCTTLYFLWDSSHMQLSYSNVLVDKWFIFAKVFMGIKSTAMRFDNYFLLLYEWAI